MDCVDVVFLDFAKAFDKVLHQKLLQKLGNHRMIGKLFTWIQLWLGQVPKGQMFRMKKGH